MLRASSLMLSHDSQTTTNPHNPLYVLHRWYWMLQLQPLSMCRQNHQDIDGLCGLVVVWLSLLSGRSLAAQARGVLGSTLSGCQPFHFPLFSPLNLFRAKCCPHQHILCIALLYRQKMWPISGSLVVAPFSPNWLKCLWQQTTSGQLKELTCVVHALWPHVVSFIIYPLASNMSVVLVLDLSKPEELWNTQETFVKQVRLTTPTSPACTCVYSTFSWYTRVQTGFSLEIYFRMMNPVHTPNVKWEARLVTAVGWI